MTVLFIFVGVILVVLALALPILMEGVIARRGGGAFTSGYLRLLTPFVTLASMASTFVAAAAILSFERSRPTGLSAQVGMLTVAIFALELSLAVYLSFTRALTAWGLLGIYFLIGLVPFGLACTMFTLATIVLQSHEVDSESKA